MIKLCFLIKFINLRCQHQLLIISMQVPKTQNSSLRVKKNSQMRDSSKISNSPQKSEFRVGRSDAYGVRFKRKVLKQFQPEIYITGNLTYEEVIGFKEVFDAYDSTGMGVLLPNDIKLLLGQNGLNPNKKTIYEIVAQFDVEETGGISFSEFMKAMDAQPYRNQDKKLIASIFKKYDRQNKNYLTLNDLKEMNNHVKEALDEQTLKLMLEKADSNHDGLISFEDFYSVMIKKIY